MTGYQEVFSDPSYFGQLMITTNVHIGNYGTVTPEMESSRFQISGLICRNFSYYPSRYGTIRSLADLLAEYEVPAIEGIDTRALVVHIRQKGAMNGIFSSEQTDVDFLKEKLAEVPDMKGLSLVHKVSCSNAYEFNGSGTYRVAVMDFGVKQNILRLLAAQNLHVKVFPWDASFEDIMSFNPHGFHLSNGPGDPAALPRPVETARHMIASGLPVFGICLGQQLIAEAYGISTFKMKNGHRGINHPVKNLESGHCEITSQNHGFSISGEELNKNTDLVLTHVNLNDGTPEGFRHKSQPVFSVQYHPEAAPGPHDSRYLFEQFTQLLHQKHAG